MPPLLFTVIIKDFMQHRSWCSKESGNNQNIKIRQIFIVLSFGLFKVLPLVNQIIFIS